MWYLKDRSGSIKTQRNLTAGISDLEVTRSIEKINSGEFSPSLLLSIKILISEEITGLLLENSINLVLRGWRDNL
jgi:hypothetical protein